MSSLPLELLATILSFLSEPSSQLQASQVCSTWKDVMGNLWWKRLMTWERKSSPRYTRPLFSTSPPSDEKCGLIVQVGFSVQLVGVVALLPSQCQPVECSLRVSSYASAHSGPHGPLLAEVKLQSSHHTQSGEKNEDRNHDCHQINLLLSNPLPLVPLVYYQTMMESLHGHDDMPPPVKYEEREKLFGRSSPPVRRDEEREVLQKPLRWFEMKKNGLQPVGKQLPIIYYIS